MTIEPPTDLPNFAVGISLLVVSVALTHISRALAFTFLLAEHLAYLIHLFRLPLLRFFIVMQSELITVLIVRFPQSFFGETEIDN